MKQPVLLAVDDDATVLAAITRDLLKRYGRSYRVLRAATGTEALPLLRRLKLRGVAVALLLVDQRMAGMSGVEFLRQALKLYPDARRVLLTAYADTDASIAAINQVGLHHYLLKPWDPAEERLYPVLDELLEDWRAQASPAAAGLRVVASRWSAEAHQVRDFMVRHQVPYRWLEVEESAEATALLAAAAAGESSELPLVVFEDGGVLARPSDAELAERIGLRTRPRASAWDLVIVGAGPAGLAAAVHAASEGYRTLLVEKQAAGGQAGLSARIENYPGFPVGLSGADLARRALAQARRLGAEIIAPVAATSLRVEHDHPVLTLADGSELAARALLISSGVQYRRVAVPGADRLVGLGVYYGAALTEAVRVSDRDVHILGAGNSAGQAALHLARFARSVTLLARSPRLESSMSQYLRARIEATPNIAVRTGSELSAVNGGERLESLTVLHRASGRLETVASYALFVFIGATAHTDWLDGVVQRDQRGFIYSGPDIMSEGRRPAGWNLPRDPLLLETSVPGVFVAGDVRHTRVRGVAAAVGEGNMAAQLIHQHLNSAALQPRAAAPLAGVLA